MRGLILLVIATVALSGCWEGTTRSICATVLASNKSSAVPNEGSKVCPGSVLRTTEVEKVNLQLIPGALAQLAENSEVKIDNLQITKDGNETGEAIRDRRARLQLKRGTMLVLFEGFAHFEIETPAAKINVLPSCLFQLEVTERKTRLICIRGKVTATSATASMVTIGGGFFYEWPGKQEAPMRSADDEHAQSATASTVKTARELQELAAANRDHLPL